MTDLTTMPDRHIVDAMIYAERRLAEHLEMDCMGGGEYDCPRCSADRDFMRAANAEMKRREEAGILIEDPDEPSFEERHAPWGPEWQLEQREREGWHSL
jgi:hypothetical protein